MQGRVTEWRRRTREADDGARIATIVFVAIVAAIAANALANAVAISQGLMHPFSSFLPKTNDLYADYFKFVLSLPGGADIRPGYWFGMHDVIVRHQAFNALHPPTAIGTMPLTTLFVLSNVAAMRTIDPAILFVGFTLSLLLYWSVVVSRVARSRDERVAWIAVGAISYPALMMIERGNLYAGATAVLLVHAMVLAGRGQAPWRAAVLLGIAVAIRPNALVFALPLLVLGGGGVRAVAVAVAVAVGATLASLLAAHAIYPGYSLATMGEGVKAYYQLYVVEGFGTYYGSSMYGGLRLLFAYHPGLDRIALLPAAVVLTGAAGLGLAGRIRASSLVFLTCAGYCLGSTIIADYHLLVFAVAPMLLATEVRAGQVMGREGWAVLLASILILSPKNYVYTNQLSWQVLANPLILIVASGIVVWSAARAWHAHRPAIASIDVARLVGGRRALRA